MFDDDYCKDMSPCGVGQGGCKSDGHCGPGLVCGRANCNCNQNGWPDHARCCTLPPRGRGKKNHLLYISRDLTNDVF